MNVLHAKIAVFLHMNSLHIIFLLSRVLPLAFAAPVDGDFAVVLHPEFDSAVIAQEALAIQQPLVVSKGAMRHGEWV